jgi:hypothetical protein
MLELSRSHARTGAARPALLAAWAADVHALHALLWENGLAEAPDARAQLAGLGEAVATALDAVAAQVDGPVTLRQVHERVRAALWSVFDVSVHDLLAERMPPAEHLDGLPGVPPQAAERARAIRLGGRTPEQLVRELDTAAADCLAVAEAMRAVGDDEGAEQQERHARLATLEADLVRAALRVGDTGLLTVDLGWDAAGIVEEEAP